MRKTEGLKIFESNILDVEDGMSLDGSKTIELSELESFVSEIVELEIKFEEKELVREKGFVGGMVDVENMFEFCDVPRNVEKCDPKGLFSSLLHSDSI